MLSRQGMVGDDCKGGLDEVEQNRQHHDSAYDGQRATVKDTACAKAVVHVKRLLQSGWVGRRVGSIAIVVPLMLKNNCPLLTDTVRFTSC
jgi:hypothetical protein